MDSSSTHQTVQEYLEQRLPTSIITVLERASNGWSQPLFSYDAVNETFEPAIEIDDEPDPEVIDALCIAAETLSGHHPVRQNDPLLQPEESAGFAHLTYNFDPDETEVYHRFQALIEENISTDAGFTAEFKNEPWGAQVTITLTYLSDFDYQSKKDTLDTMLIIARKWVSKTPFLGEKL